MSLRIGRHHATERWTCASSTLSCSTRFTATPTGTAALNGQRAAFLTDPEMDAARRQIVIHRLRSVIDLTPPRCWLRA